MDYRLQDLTAEALAAALVTGIEQPARRSRQLDGASSTSCRPSPTTSSSAIRWSSSATARSAARWRRRRGCASRSCPGTSSSSTRGSRPTGGRFWFREFSADYGRPTSYARMRPTLEGGDILVLREDMLAIGYSERTEKTTIERLAESFKARKSPIKRIFVVAIPPARSYMHLDTVFTVISRDECLVYGPMILPDGPEEADVYECDLTKREITWTTEKDLLSALRTQKMDLKPIRCGGTDPIAERREQWTDGANAFAIAPGVILIYDRNERTAEELAPARLPVVRRGGPAARRDGAAAAQEEEVRDPPRGARAVPRPRRPALHGDAARARGPPGLTRPAMINRTPFFSFVRPLAVVAFGGNALLRPGGLGHDGGAARPRPGGGPPAAADPRPRLRARRRARQRAAGRQHPHPGRGRGRPDPAPDARLLRRADGGLDGISARARLRQRAVARPASARRSSRS